MCFFIIPFIVSLIMIISGIIILKNPTSKENIFIKLMGGSFVGAGILGSIMMFVNIYF